jgi:hypothetical protein
MTVRQPRVIREIHLKCRPAASHPPYPVQMSQLNPIHLHSIKFHQKHDLQWDFKASKLIKRIFSTKKENCSFFNIFYLKKIENIVSVLSRDISKIAKETKMWY